MLKSILKSFDSKIIHYSHLLVHTLDLKDEGSVVDSSHFVVLSQQQIEKSQLRLHSVI